MVTPQFGGPDLFEERDVEKPQPEPGEVLVRVFAAGTNPVDAKFRAAGSSAGLEAPIILGADISGVVEEAGSHNLLAGRRGVLHTGGLRSPLDATWKRLDRATVEVLVGEKI